MPKLRNKILAQPSCAPAKLPKKQHMRTESMHFVMNSHDWRTCGQSKMLWSFVGTEKLGNREIVDFLEGVGQTYGLGWFEGRDGMEHCGIDQEELKTSYRHGLDNSRSNKPWIESFSEWL